MADSTKTTTAEDAVEYEVLIGLNYPPNRRAEPGDIVTDLPFGSKGFLTELGVVKRVAD